VSPSISIVSIPLALIAVASFAVRHQDHSFQTSPRTAQIQTPVPVPVRLLPGSGTQIPAEKLPVSQQPLYGRYGFDESVVAGTQLGRDSLPRGLGERASAPPDWLSIQQSIAAKKSPFPEIPGYRETPPPRDPLAEPLAVESGYQITSDEVTRLDMETGRVVFNRNVRMVSPQFHLTCDQLVVHLGKDKNSMDHSEAHGSVNILLTGVPPEKAYRGQSSDAVFHPQKNQIVLTGWPKARGASQEQVAAEAGTRMTLFTKTGRLLTEGRAQTRVTRSFMSESTSATKK
jgi:lipopolysaccharide transport protein LptA